MSRRQTHPSPKRSLSQVFLIDKNPLSAFEEFLSETSATHILEIGPGPGILTETLVNLNAQILAVEKDERMIPVLQERFESTKNLTVIEGDFLKFDIDEWLSGLPKQSHAAIVGNIPYNISTPIVLKIISFINRLSGSMLLVQKEFGKRIAAPHGKKDYGALSVYTQLRCQPRVVKEVSRNCFRPVPDVDSVIISLEPHQKFSQHSAQTLEFTEKVTRKVFSQRRKMLKNTVAEFLQDKNAAGCPIELSRRPETLSPEEFVALSTYLMQRV